MRIRWIAAAAMLAIWPGFGHAQSSAVIDVKEPSLSVNGQGRIEVPPDYANVTVEVETRAKTAGSATSSHEARAARAMNLLRDLKPQGVEIVRSNFRLQEQRTPPPPTSPNQQPDTQFEAITSFELKMTKMDAIDEAITKMALSDLVQVRNLRFGLKDDNPGGDAARKRAVANARSKAEVYAEAAGVKLGEILRIEDAEPQAPVMFSAQAPTARKVQVVPPEGLTLTASVTITWRIAAKP